jgi:hypothetical protein
MKKLLLNISIFLLSCFIGLFLIEGALRLFFNPIDYLKPEIVAHPSLGHKIKSNSAGHDAWGFRNKEIPNETDIVTIGDSQTYGDGAPMEGSWPYLLSMLTGLKVYNLALGGYGPPQYLYLLKEKSLRLNPSQILVGLYCGNDFFNSYEMVYGYDYWKKYMNKESKFSAPQYLTRKVIEANNPSFLSLIRGWLGGNSILYRKIGNLIYQVKIVNNKKILKDPRFIFFEDPKHNIRTGFKSETRLKEIDFNNPENYEGYRITIEMLSEMRDICEAEGIKFSIVVIPTKSLVFWDLIEKANNNGKFDDIRKIVESELKWRKLIFDEFTLEGIKYIDPLEKMKEAVGRIKIYHEDLNDHPNQAGYEIIARVVAETVK